MSPSFPEVPRTREAPTNQSAPRLRFLTVFQVAEIVGCHSGDYSARVQLWANWRATGLGPGLAVHHGRRRGMDVARPTDQANSGRSGAGRVVRIGGLG